jgi:hypothetical protein
VIRVSGGFAARMRCESRATNMKHYRCDVPIIAAMMAIARQLLLRSEKILLIAQWSNRAPERPKERD